MHRISSKLLLVGLCMLLTGCNSQIVDNIDGDPQIANNPIYPAASFESRPAPTQTQQVSEKQPEPTNDTFSSDFVAQYLNSGKSIQAVNDGIPCFNEQELLYDSGCFSLGMDGAMDNGSFTLNLLERIVKIFSNKYPREIDDNIYLVYNTDKNTRLFLFFSFEKSGGMLMSGFPVIMEKRLSYKDFEGIKISDKIREVERIDPVTPLYRANFDQFPDTLLKHMKEQDIYLESIHLLTDGVIGIKYERNGDGEYIVNDVDYEKEYSLAGPNGETKYKIYEEDYVK